MRFLGVDLPASGAAGGSLVVLDDEGRVADCVTGISAHEIVAGVVRFAPDEPFLLGIDIPVVVGPKAVRTRPVENVVRRRFGFRLPPGGRAALASEPQGVLGEALLAGLAAAGRPCLPYPDRDRRQPGMIEAHPGLILKALLWIESPLGDGRESEERQTLFRAYAPAAYRAARLGSRTSWAERAAALDQVVCLVERIDGFDASACRESLASAGSEQDVELAAGLLDASLLAATARRYLESPEACLFLGDTEGGYVVLPADGFIRGLAAESRPSHGRLFPTASIRKRLGPDVKVRSADLIDIPGRPHRLEARFDEPPRYEFDNLDEMLWWKHTRHVSGKRLPTEGLTALVVTLDDGRDASGPPLFLVRSRHRTLSFRFDPPQAWRSRMATRDGKMYAFRVLQATYETRGG
jgi:predicted RNase H-like nuclease